MANFAADIEEVAKGEPIEAIVIGAMGGYEWEEDIGERVIPVSQRNKILSWEEARPLLDYEYGTGYGGVECHAIYAWTPTRILFVSQYDGSTEIESAPRNPTAGSPGIPGG
jgi:hypothetical protein